MPRSAGTCQPQTKVSTRRAGRGFQAIFIPHPGHAWARSWRSAGPPGTLYLRGLGFCERGLFQGYSRHLKSMAAHGEPLATKKRLDSWKEIATFFGRDERTVKRWEKERGLPVYRVPGSARGGVFAYADELADWLKTPKPDWETGETAFPESASAEEDTDRSVPANLLT